MTITQATRITVKRYLRNLEEIFLKETTTQKEKKQAFALIAMCQTILKNTSEYDNGENIMTEDKISRWLGYIQGVMVVYGWLSVEQERDLTRPLFHESYKNKDIEPPSITAGLDDTVIHVTSMQELNDLAEDAFGVKSYKDLPDEKILNLALLWIKDRHPKTHQFLNKLNYDFYFQNSNYDKDGKFDKSKRFSFIFYNLALKEEQ